MRTLFLAFLLLGTACSLDEGSAPSSILDAGNVPDQGIPVQDASDTTDASASSDAVVVDAPVDSPPPPPDGGCDPNACPGERCESGVCSYYLSCSDMHQDVTRQTGAKKLRDPKAVVFDAWCDMDIDGGGWTLIGRSFVGASSSNFGWKKSTGSITDDLSPYSLNPDVHGLVFTEALIGGYSIGKTWFGSVYKAVLPANFLASYKNSAGATTVSKVGGACSDTSPFMFTNMGYVDNNDQFFMRDNGSAGSYGLRPGGFSLGYVDCQHAALLNGAPGLIAVR